MMDFFMILCCATAFLILRHVSDLLNFFNPAIYFFWVYLLFCTLGVFYRNTYTYAIDISNNTIALIGFGLVSYCCGVLLASNKRKKLKLKAPLLQIVESGIEENTYSLKWILAACLLPIVISVIFTIQAGEILWLQDSFDDQRIELRKGSGSIAILGISSAYIATILVSIYAAKKKSLLIPALLLIAIIMSALSYGNRAPAIDILVISSTIIWIKRFKKITFLHFTTALTILMVAVISLGIIRQGLSFDGDMFFKQMLWRPFVNIQNTEWIVSFIPKTYRYFYGEAMLIELMVLAPGYQPNFGTYMKELLGMEFSGGSITFGIVGMLYADFGPYLAVLGMLIIGFFLQRLHLKYSASGKHFIYLVIFSISLKGMAASGIVTPLIYTLLPCLILYFAFSKIFPKSTFKGSLQKTAKMGQNN